MVDGNGGGNAYAVVSWLDDLRECAERLEVITALLESLDADADGVGAVQYDRPMVSIGAAKHDRIGESVAEREERAAALEAEAAELRAAIGNAVRVIAAAWRANRGECDGAFRYVLERYARGRGRQEAALSAGLGRYEAVLSARRVAPMIYGAAPHLFEPWRGAGRFGYFRFMRGEM